MKRTLLVPVVIGAVFFSGVTVSYGESLPVQYAETEIELVQTEERLNKVIKDVKAQELREITAFDDRTLTDKASKQLANQKKAERTKYYHLQRLQRSRIGRRSYKKSSSKGISSGRSLCDTL